MREKVPKELEKSRVKKGLFASNEHYGFNGAFYVKYRRYILTVFASDQLGWDHVSVSLPGRIPTWTEMQYVKDLFFDETETVIQFHPPKDKHINYHPHTLHLWRQHGIVYQLPPPIMIAPV